jgi:hypothetical protein
MADMLVTQTMSKRLEKLSDYLFFFIIIVTLIVIFYATETICKNVQRRLEAKQYDPRSTTLRI